MNDWRRTRLWVVALGLSAAGCSTVRYSTDHDPEVSFSEYRTYEWVAATEEEQAVMQRINPFLERRLRRAVERELEGRGFQAGREGEADFLVSVYPVVPVREGEGEASGTGGHYKRPRIGVSVGFAVGIGHPYRYGYGYGYPYFGYPFPYYGYRYPYYGYTPFWVGFGYPYFASFYPVFTYPGYGYYHSAGGYGYSGKPSWAGLDAGTVVVDVFDASSNELVWRGWAEGALLEIPRAEELDAYVDEIVGEVMKSFPPEGTQR